MTVPPPERVVIVTGAARGIGAGIARHLSGEGWRVVASDAGEAAVRVSAATIGATPIPCDVADESAVQRLVDQTRAHFGRIDAIVSNAGISRNGPLASTSLADWKRSSGCFSNSRWCSRCC